MDALERNTQRVSIKCNDLVIKLGATPVGIEFFCFIAHIFLYISTILHSQHGHRGNDWKER